MDRKRFNWTAQIADAETKEQVKVRWSSFWSPDKTEPMEVAIAVAAEHTCETRRKFVPITALKAA